MSCAYSVYTREPSGPKRLPPKRDSRKWLVRIAAGAFALLLVVGGGFGWKAHRDSERRRQLLAQLQNERNPAKLREAIRSGQLTREDARQVFASRMQSRLDAYFKLAPGPQRTKYLDQVIADAQNRRKRFESRRPPTASAKPGANAAGPAGPGAQDAGPNPSSRAARMESIAPDQRAMMQQFHLDMQQRMRQVGVASAR